MPTEILTHWNTAAGSTFLSVMYMAAGNTLASQRAALSTFWNVVDGILDNSTTWQIDNEARVLDDATGVLTALRTDATNYGGTGGVTGEQVPDVAQVLFKWNTGIILGGRFLQGKTYVPGLSNGNMVNGNLSTGIAAAEAGYGNALIAAGVGMGVWHRPVGGTGGSFRDAATCSVNTELAVQRRRRG